MALVHRLCGEVIMDDINRELKILIVDDSSSMRRIVRQFLVNNGFSNLLEARDGMDALQVVRNNTIDLIISDLNMPRMDGLRFLEILKADETTRDIPFIMLTVEAIQKTMNKAIAMGVDSYIVKPIEEHLFIGEMMRVIKEQ
jgi:two-component system chemotaxis response regulator CheY